MTGGTGPTMISSLQLSIRYQHDHVSPTKSVPPCHSVHEISGCLLTQWSRSCWIRRPHEEPAAGPGPKCPSGAKRTRGNHRREVFHWQRPPRAEHGPVPERNHHCYPSRWNTGVPPITRWSMAMDPPYYLVWSKATPIRPTSQRCRHSPALALPPLLAWDAPTSTTAMLCASKTASQTSTALSSLLAHLEVSMQRYLDSRRKT